MSTAEWEVENGGKLRHWRVSFSEGAMRIECLVARARGGQWKREGDEVVRAEDVESLVFGDNAATENDVRIFPRDYYLVLKYRCQPRGGKVKLKWWLRDIGQEDLLVLLQGLEGLLESPGSRVRERQLDRLKRFARTQERRVNLQREQDEHHARLLDDIAGAAETYRMEELAIDVSRVEARKPKANGAAWIFVFLALEILVPLVMRPVGRLLDRLLPWGASLLETVLTVALMTAFFLLLIFGLKMRHDRAASVDGQRVFLAGDGLVLLAVHPKQRLTSHRPSTAKGGTGAGATCWYSEGCLEPLRIARIDGYKVKRKSVELRGSFLEGEVSAGSDGGAAGFVPVAGGRREGKLRIWRIYPDAEEERLLAKLDAMTGAGTRAR